MRGLSSLVVFAAAALAFAGCLPPDQSGEDGGDDSSGAATGTIGGQCIRMYTALCSHAINDCAFNTIDLADCVNSGETQCCMDQCSTAAITPDVTVDECVQALMVEDCNDVAESLTPTECTGIPAL